MTSADRRAVLAIGVDAAEPTLLRRLIDEGHMPVLGRLAAEGAWRPVRSGADIGSGAVWPTFTSGTGPEVHGGYGEWLWRPDTMSIAHWGGAHLTPFWKALTDAGVPVGVVDVPFAPTLGLRDGFEVQKWGPHDAYDGPLTAGPHGVDRIVRQVGPHPLAVETVSVDGPEDVQGLEAVVAACLKGIELRGELVRRLIEERRPRLTTVVFPEIHRASHLLWHTVEPEHPLYASLDVPRPVDGARGLIELHREVDRQIGRLVEAAGETAAVVVFSLHGMRPSSGVADFLAAWLGERGFARPASWRRQSWRARAVSLFGAAKRHAPAGLRKLYYRSLSREVTAKLAQPTMLVPCDWTATRAFALPTDQHGWIRVNLEEREAAGIVRPQDYDGVCAELEAALRTLTDEAGQRLVSRIIRPAASVEAAMGLGLPDLIVHWTDAALASTLRIAGCRLVSRPIARRYLGQHDFEGFCVVRGAPAPPAGPLLATAMPGLLGRLAS